MAHIIVAVRGQRDVINRWEETLNSVFLPYETEIIDHATGKRVMMNLQLGIRPIRIYDVTYPKVQEQLVMQLLNPGRTWVDKYQKYFDWIRKLLGLNPMPEYKRQDYPHQRFVEVIGIGTKEDKTRNGVELL